MCNESVESEYEKHCVFSVISFFLFSFFRMSVSTQLPSHLALVFLSSALCFCTYDSSSSLVYRSNVAAPPPPPGVAASPTDAVVAAAVGVAAAASNSCAVVDDDDDAGGEEDNDVGVCCAAVRLDDSARGVDGLVDLLRSVI